MTRKLQSVLLLVATVAGLLFWMSPVQAQVDVYEFETLEQEQRFRQLSNEFRCPMCQNANLSSSPGGVAADLRREIYRMIMEGQTDTEIEQFMLSRYGDFVLYRPRLTLQTVLLWFGPLLFLLLGAWVAWNIIRRSAESGVETHLGNTSADSDEDLAKAVVITADERERLNRLLSDAPSAPTSDNTGR
ncbi:MAG: cytochrome c-type biogenesis protein CcmH [Gammaproteobacteria bacterium]|nr:cytochrome c-type biogenesis protein CcmH [Gammaproteobacteria bacterium]